MTPRSETRSPYPHIFNVLFSGQYSETQLQTGWQEGIPELPEHITSQIDVFWQAHVMETDTAAYVFDGALAGLTKWRQHNSSLYLDLHCTKYRRLYFARWQYDEQSTIIDQHRLASALGISVILISCDEQIIVMQRSRTVGESPDKYDVIGGHLEPVEHAVDGIPNPFQAIRAELKEEINFVASQHEPIYCIGLIETVAPAKPEIFFRIKSKLSCKDILKTAAEISCNEIASLFTIANEKAALEYFIKRDLYKLSPSALGVLWLYAQSLCD